jgi:ParB-like chromosome segregation protein Spo0J
MSYELHPLCTLFPRMSGAEFNALVSDIKTNGQREPIILHEGMILDGGNRYRACVEAGVKPETMRFGGGNIVAYVLSANLHRRHLSAGQQAAIVASAQDWGNAQTHGGERKVDQGATLHFDTVADRAAQSGASLRTQKSADKVAKASPELAKQVAHGEISLPKAVEQITGKKSSAAPIQPDHDEAAMRAEMMQDALVALNEENESLKSQIATMLFVGDEDEKQSYLARLNALTDENKQLKILNNGLIKSRDAAMAENNAMRKQLTLNAKKLKAAA